MSVVDEKGRLFGKVNLLDLVVVVAVVAVGARFGYSHFMAKSAGPAGTDQKVELTFKVSPVTQPTVDAIQKGDKVYDSKSNAFLGTVVETKAQPATVVKQGPDGRLWETQSTTAFDYYVTISSMAHVSENGVLVGGDDIKIGRDNSLRTRLWAGSGTTAGINQSPTR
ncbi:MAG: DUF4330 domain-containing protein [Mycobacterium leprae]